MEADDAASQDKGCPDGKEDRYSDLCAQWKAADAAKEAADWAAWGFFGSVVATGLLIWTLMETRGATRRELRAYVSIRMNDFHRTVVRDTKAFDVAFDVFFKNGGSTPAYKCVRAGNACVFTPQEAIKFFANARNAPQVGDEITQVLHSGSEEPCRFSGSATITARQAALTRAHEASLYAFGYCRYVDTFGRKHETRFCYIAENAFAEIPGATGKFGQIKTDMTWVMAPFHNDAT